jgi:acyl dehydratase
VSVRTFESAQQLFAAAGDHIGSSEWHTITQQRIQAFADATDDHQWIHLDAERAATGPFGTTVAHGFLTLSLIPMLVREVYRVEQARMVVNYGLNRVRFPAPLPSGSDVRADVELLNVAEHDGRVQVTSRVTVNIRDAEKPCCVAETLTLVYF